MSATCYTLTTAASTNLNRVSAGSEATKLKGWVVTNTAAYAIFIKLYWSNTLPVVGTTVPAMTITCPAAATSGGGTAFNISEGVTGNGTLWIWVTKLAAASDTTVLVSGDGLITLLVEG